MNTNEIILGIDEVGFYDFIANNYWKLSKEELKDIALEIIYASYRDIEVFNGGKFEDTEKNALVELEERLSY